MNFRWCVTLLLGAATVLGHVGVAAAQNCEALKKLSLPGANVTGVESVAAGVLKAGDVPEGTEKQVQAALARLPALCRDCRRSAACRFLLNRARVPTFVSKSGCRPQAGTVVCRRWVTAGSQALFRLL
jgi:hypothetical protein